MTAPPLLLLNTATEYRDYYENNYCRATIVTFDGFRVFFKATTFGHAFYKNSQGKQGAKDAICPIRCQRMGWVKHTLVNPNAQLYMGWNKAQKVLEENRRVSVVYEDFVVVIELSLNNKGELKANFVTCYQADISIGAIKSSPTWDKDKCLQKLRGNE